MRERGGKRAKKENENENQNVQMDFTIINLFTCLTDAKYWTP